MSEIQDLENKIKELRERQDWEILYNRYLCEKRTYEGRCFASHALTKPLPAYKKHNNETLFTATKIDKVYIGAYNSVINNFEEWKQSHDSNCLATGEQLYVRITSDNQFSISLNKFKNTTVDRSFFILPQYYDITVELFNSIKELLLQNNNNFFSTILTKLDVKPYIDNDEVESLKRWGAKMVDLSSDEIYALKSKPFIYDGQLIVNKVSIVMVKELLNEALEDDKRDRGFWVGTEYCPPSGYHKRQINILTNILNKMKEND